MRCNLCGSMDAQIRECELSVARYSLRAHVDCNGHGQYRAISPEDIAETKRLIALERKAREERNKREERRIAAAPDMYELISDLSQAYDDNQSSHELASRLYDLRCRALRLMAKIEGGGE